jgi:hypothetical protein
VRIGLLGPGEDEALFREAAGFLLQGTDVEQVVYLGDATFLEGATARWVKELGVASESAFLERALDVAMSGNADAVEALLVRDTLTSRLAQIRKLPPPPARAIELVDDRVVIFVHDKAVLDEDDIANAAVVVYGRATEAGVRRFGKRLFVTPGPLEGRRVAFIEDDDNGAFVSLVDLEGRALLREPLTAGSTKMTVAG